MMFGSHNPPPMCHCQGLRKSGMIFDEYYNLMFVVSCITTVSRDLLLTLACKFPSTPEESAHDILALLDPVLVFLLLYLPTCPVLVPNSSRRSTQSPHNS
mmetsp:Transcript_41692/g.100397  ORF Transcript_41692/g.100397 Transcript_41692/m.100397 type:complete len:100 (+) Transcript_41692:259-558(+)